MSVGSTLDQTLKNAARSTLTFVSYVLSTMCKRATNLCQVAIPFPGLLQSQSSKERRFDNII